MRTFGSFRPKKAAADCAYAIGDCVLRLPCDHALPSYQREHRLYDRLLPAFASEDFGGWIIDIGANVGDSAAALAAAPPKKFLCVEPSPTYFSYLSLNAEVIARGGSTLRLANVAISQDRNSVTIAEADGTATRSSSGTAVSTITLDDLVDEMCGADDVSFIKCDVDGYDADVLLSGPRVFEKHHPVALFECDIKRSDEVGDYEALIEYLAQLGYRMACFDNFGLPLCDTNDASITKQMVSYVSRLRQSRSTRTLYYIDILAYRDSHAFVARSLKRYSDIVDDV